MRNLQSWELGRVAPNAIVIEAFRDTQKAKVPPEECKSLQFFVRILSPQATMASERAMRI
jgi:hypothetical protein